MFEFISITIAFIVFIIAIFFAVKNRNNMSKWISCVLLGVFFATFFMVLPTAWINEGKTVECPILYSALSSLLYSFKALGGRQDIAQIETIALSGIFKTFYIYFNYIIFTLAPILASSLILSFIADFGDKIKYFFAFSKNVYVFSEINENSLSLAEGLLNNKEKTAIIFCKTKDAKKEDITKARKLGAILFHKSCEDIKTNKKHKKFEFCIINHDEDANLKIAETLVTKHSKSNRKVTINTFIESGTGVKLLENVSKTKGENNIELRCIDEIAFFCNHLIFNHPLYDTKGNGKNISVAIIGCGRTGMRMLKTVYWAGQIEGYSLKIRVYDKDACKIEKNFYRECPGLKDNQTIKFIETNVDTLDFQEKLLNQENSKDATYIIVAMGDDQLNLSVADDISKIYRKNRNFGKDQMPEIFARVRSKDKTGPYFNDTSFLKERNINLFGTTESIFSDTTLFNTELENMAFAVHLAYWERTDKDKNSAEFKEVYNDFKTSEYERRSSMAAALHIPAKLCICDEIPKNDNNILTDKNIDIFEKSIKTNDKLLEKLMRNEHDRWNAFMLTEGYIPASLEEMMQYSKITKNHRDDLSMLHPCITDWDSLDILENAFNTAYNKNKHFKYYDKEIVEKIPVIYKIAKSRKGDN